MNLTEGAVAENWRDEGFPVLAVDELPTTGTGYTESIGELRLLAAVLADALEKALRRHDIQDSTDRREAERTRQEAIEWIFSEDESSLCSFLNVCDVLKLEPTGIRDVVARRILEGSSLSTYAGRVVRRGG